MNVEVFKVCCSLRWMFVPDVECCLCMDISSRLNFA